MQLNDLEKKLMALALDSAVEPGEMVNASVKLIESFRRRSLRVEDFEANAQTADRGPNKFWRPDYGLCIWPWGKYKGFRFKDIDPGYLRYQMDWIKSDWNRANKFAHLIIQIENFLEI